MYFKFVINYCNKLHIISLVKVYCFAYFLLRQLLILEIVKIQYKNMLHTHCLAALQMIETSGLVYQNLPHTLNSYLTDVRLQEK